MERIELEPCPFCGCKPELFINMNQCFYKNYKIQCSNPFCIIHNIMTDYTSTNDAINIWNRRAVITERNENDQN